MTETNQQNVFISDASPMEPRHVFQTTHDGADVEVAFPAGCKFRVYLDAEGFVSGIVTYHETIDDDGVRRGHENDYFFGPPSPHEDSFQVLGPKLADWP